MAKLSNSPVEATVLEVEARKSFAFTVTIAAPNGAPADLTGAAVRFVVGLPEGATLEVPAVIDMPLAGTAVVPVQADDLALDAGAYPFVVVLVTGGYSLVLVKGDLKVRANPEQASASQEYGGASPATGLSVVLAGLQVVRVTLWGGVPAGVDGGLDASGVAAGLTPVAQGDGSWAWGEPPVSVDWSEVTGTDAVVLRPELDAYAKLDGATFTGPVHIPALTTPELAADDAAVEYELRVGPADAQLSLAYGTISATEDGTPVDVSFPTGITDLPVPIDPSDAATKAYADAVATTAKTEAIAAAAAAQNPPWIPVTTFSADWRHLVASSYGPVQYRIVGDVVEISGPAQTTVARSGGTSYRVLTLPSAAWPTANRQIGAFSAQIVGTGTTTGAFSTYMCFCGPDGGIAIYPGITGASMSANAYIFINGRFSRS